MHKIVTTAAALILSAGAFAAGQHFAPQAAPVDQTYTGKQIAAYIASQHNTAYGNRLHILPCIEEDSRNCIWNADTSGNGEGDSFIDYQGTAYYPAQ